MRKILWNKHPTRETHVRDYIGRWGMGEQSVGKWRRGGGIAHAQTQAQILGASTCACTRTLSGNGSAGP